MTFKAEGWTEKLAEPTDKHKELPNKVMITKVSGIDPAYKATCTMLLLSGVTILKESDKIPVTYVIYLLFESTIYLFYIILLLVLHYFSGGVLTPGAAFSKTSLIEELIKKDIKFEVVSSLEK